MKTTQKIVIALLVVMLAFQTRDLIKGISDNHKRWKEVNQEIVSLRQQLRVQDSIRNIK